MPPYFPNNNDNQDFCFSRDFFHNICETVNKFSNCQTVMGCCLRFWNTDLCHKSCHCRWSHGIKSVRSALSFQSSGQVCYGSENTFLVCILLGSLCNQVHSFLQFEHVDAHQWCASTCSNHGPYHEDWGARSRGNGNGRTPHDQTGGIQPPWK